MMGVNLMPLLFSDHSVEDGDNCAQKAHDSNFVSNNANKIQAGKIEIANVTPLGKKIYNKNNYVGSRIIKVQVAKKGC